jgi:hypothetical protein
MCAVPYRREAAPESIQPRSWGKSISWLRPCIKSAASLNVRQLKLGHLHFLGHLRFWVFCLWNTPFALALSARASYWIAIAAAPPGRGFLRTCSLHRWVGQIGRCGQSTVSDQRRTPRKIQEGWSPSAKPINVGAAPSCELETDRIPDRYDSFDATSQCTARKAELKDDLV